MRMPSKARAHVMGRLRFLPLGACLLVAGIVLASTAGAHVGTFDATCYEVSYHFTEFPNAQANTVSVDVALGSSTVHRDVVWNGPDTSGTIPFDATAGGVVHVEATWNTNGVAGDEVADIPVTACLPTTTTTAPTTTTTVVAPTTITVAAPTTTTTAPTTTTTTAPTTTTSSSTTTSTTTTTTTLASAVEAQTQQATTTAPSVSQGAATAPGGAGRLAFTGDSTGTQLMLGLALIVLGVITTVVSMARPATVRSRER